MRVLHLGRELSYAVKEYEQFCRDHEIHRVVATGIKSANACHKIEMVEKTRAEVKQLIHDQVRKNGPFQAVLSYGAFNIGKLDGELFSPALPDLKFYASSGAGTDKLDLDWFTKNGVHVSNTPNAVTKSTADGTALLILSAIKNATMVVAQAKSDGPWRADLPLMGDPEDMVLGIIGMGKIGQEVAKRMNAFGMRVVYHNRSHLSTVIENELNVSYVSMEELLQTADVIALTCPLTPETQHILNKDSLSKAKHGVIVVNSARGGCIDTQALIDALESGQVANAALDVFEDEPNIPQYFKDSKKVMVMPHYCAFTRGTMTLIENALMDNINTYARKGHALHAVNEPVA